MSKTIISLTTIPPRINLIRPTLESLTRQIGALVKADVPQSPPRAEAPVRAEPPAEQAPRGHALVVFLAVGVGETGDGCLTAGTGHGAGFQ